MKRWIRVSIVMSIIIVLMSSPILLFFVFMGCDPCDFGIKIYKDRHFKKYAVSGDGSLGDPYILNSLNITTDTPNGIDIGRTSAYFIIQNSFLQADEFGVNIHSISSGRGKIINNTFFGCGIEVSSSKYLLIEGNIFIENSNGIILSNSESNTIQNNVLDSYGINLDNPLQFISNNTVGGKDIGFYTDESNQAITMDFGQIIISSCYNLTFSSSNINNVGIGITLFDSQNCTILNSQISNSNTGIIAKDSSNLVLNNITLADFPQTNSYMHKDGYGILIESSDYLIIQNCTIDEARYQAISISESDYCLLEFNRIINSRFSGLDLYRVNYGEFIFNEFSNNTEWFAISLSGENNKIHHNNFINNAVNFSSQVRDGSLNNYWYDTVALRGNYWSDSSYGIDYIINEDLGIFDLYPFLYPINIFG